MSAGPNIYEALEAARKDFPPIVKDKENLHFGNRYASLEQIVEAVSPGLSAFGLVPVQTVKPLDGGLMVVTELRHRSSGESLSCEIPLPPESNPQKVGSAISYYRRYGLVTLLGLVTEEDDDGNDASPPPPPRSSGGGFQKTAPASSKPALDDELGF